MSSVSIKKLVEEKVKGSSNKLENKVQITFKTLKNESNICETITLRGQGTVKVLIPA